MDCNFGSDTQPTCQLLPALGEAGVRIVTEITALVFSHGSCYPSDSKWSWMATRHPLGTVILTNYDRSYKEKQTDSHPEPRVSSDCQDAHMLSLGVCPHSKDEAQGFEHMKARIHSAMKLHPLPTYGFDSF